jgi:molecular chaperone DnaJ
VGLEEYYKRLELPGTASPADVKRAYRRLRAKYHPDRNKGREATVEPAFKRIQEAFEILTGKRKRPASSPASTSAASGERKQEAAPPEHRSTPPMRGANCLVELFVPLEAAIHGGDVAASYAVNGPCRPCQEKASECVRCYGSGQTVSGTRCTACAGTGRPLTGDRCPTCAGTGIGTYRMLETVKVPAGAWDGQRLVVEGGGHPGVNGGPAGDAIFSVAIVCDSSWRRSGLNLACEIEVDFLTATLGGAFATQILGRAQEITIAPNTQPGSTIRLRGHGLADRKGSHGDMTLHVVLGMPAAAAHLSFDDRQRLREMFAEAERRGARTSIFP